MGQRRGPGKQKLEGISVFVRVRDSSEDEKGSSEVVEINDSETSVCVRDAERPNKSIRCAFDRVFGRDSTQEDVFNGLEPALDTVVEGFNACVLAYGQTGSGKTHTLIGPNGGTRLPDDRTEWGIIPRAVQFLFDRLNLASEEDETFSYSVTCSFLQIYNENLVDLLLQDGGTAATSATLQIREEAGGERGRNRVRGGGDAKYALRNRYTSADGSDVEGAATGVDGRARGVVGHHQNRPIPKPHGSRAIDNRRVFVNGLSSFRVGGAQDVLRYVNLGAANRRVRATQHNEASSRSHAVMQLTVEVKSGGGGGDGESRDGVVGSGHVTYRQAKLSLVDLAGSEKMDSGLYISKGHFKELRSINQSLSTLGNVVSALSEKGRTHVPYRDSKLTRLLQDSLGGNTRTTIIACVNPLAGQTHETINTLQFADRAKKVMVRIRANEVVDDRVLLARAQSEIKRLKRRLREALEGTLLGGSTEDDGESNDTITGTDVEVQGPGGAPEDTVRVSKKVEDFGPGGSTTGRKGGTGAKHGEADGMVSSPTVVADNGQQHRRSSTGEKKCEIVGISTVAATAAATASTDATASCAASASTTQNRKAAKLISENESLREENDRLRADVQRLIIQNNKQRSKRQRQQQRQQQRQRNAGRLGETWNGAGTRKPPPSPIDWSARYADAAADARRRRPASSSHRSRSLTRSASSSSATSRTVAMRGKTSASPSRTAATVAVAPVVPKFRRRQFGMDEGTRKGTGSENGAVEGTLSAEEIRAMIDINAAEAKVDATALVDPTDLDEEEEEKEAEEVAQLAMFHRELREGVVSGSFVKRDGGGGGDEGNRRGGRGAIEGREAVQERSDGREDSSDSNANPDELTNIDVFLDQSQRLEDLMFEAEGRERRRLQEERGRLASARAERLALEAQLMALTGSGKGCTNSAHDSSDADKEVPTHVSSDDFEEPPHRNSLTIPPVLTTMPSPSSGHIEGQAAKAVGFYHRPHCQQPQRPPPPFDGALLRQHEHGRTATVQTTPPSAERVEPMVATTSHGNIRVEGDHARKGICWTEQRIGSTTTNAVTAATADLTTTAATTAATTAMMMAVLAPRERGNCSTVCDVHDAGGQGNQNTTTTTTTNNNNNNNNNNVFELESLSGARAGRTVPATKPPIQRNRHGRTERTNSSPTPPSPSSLSRRDSHLATSLRQRPATSTGYPPTGTSRAKSRSRRIRQRAGVRMGRSRSPIRAGREAFAEPASPEKRRIDGQRGGSQQHRTGQKQYQQRRQQQGNTGDKNFPARLMAAASSNENASIELQQAAGNPRLSSAPSEIDQKLGRKAGGSEASGAGAIEEQTTKRTLNYSVADLGLRLKVYSFRYDHYYECQVVGYDSRRRMHRCAYDATGERHWHDLANKRFEVSGQNGVKVRSTASAPPAPAPGRPPRDATKKSFSSRGSDESSNTPLRLPTSPRYPLGISFGNSVGGSDVGSGGKLREGT